MARHFLKYWEYKTVKAKLKSPMLLITYSASDQYINRVSVEDTVWLVTVIPKSVPEQLYLFGVIQVGWVGQRTEAARLLDMAVDELYDGDNFVVSLPNIPEPCEMILINDIALDLRFDSPTGKNQLPSKNFAQSLQAMRNLTDESAMLLQAIWYKEMPDAPHVDTANMEQFTEGARKLVVHEARERNKKLVAKAKAHFKKANGHLFCEVCAFNFSQVYGEVGEDFIEAHHRQPMSELEEDEAVNSIDDLAMVCANCHRMLHRRKPWLTVEELQITLKKHSKSS